MMEAGVGDTAAARPEPSLPKGGEGVEPSTTTGLFSSHLPKGGIPSAEEAGMPGKGAHVRVET